MSTSVALAPAILALLGGSNPGWPPADPAVPAEALADPANMPDDPDYRPVPDPLVGCRGELELFSFTPPCTPAIRQAERPLGPGIAVDRAWLWTTGRPEVAIAVLDSGIDWSDRDLVLRVRLNPGELPVPVTGLGTALHDANGDGVFNVQDYTVATGTVVPTVAMIADPRLRARPDRGDANGNGILDPEDLIRAFANGTDDDGDGWVDDIAGFDVLDGDPDPADPDGPASHGAAMARAIAATANDGYGHAGACPRCMIVPVRVGAGRLAPGRALGAGLVFAADTGARLVAAFTAAAGSSTFVQAAVAHALSRGVPIVAAAGDAASPSREVPWPPDQVLITGALAHDQPRRDLATTALAPAPTSNYGAQLSLVAPPGQSDLAAGVVAGAAGLVLSAALGIPEKGVPPLSPALSPRELYALLTRTADDVPAGVAPPLTRSGWDEYTAFGRINARRAVDAVLAGQLPVETEISSPAWQAIIDPSSAGTFDVTGAVRNHRARPATWTLEYAPGSAPDSGAFRTIASGMAGAGEAVAVGGQVPLDQLVPDPTAASEAASDFAITLRLSASLVTQDAAGARPGSAGGDGGATSQARRLVFAHRDLESFPAFPLALGAAVLGSPRIADVDGDGRGEIIVATEDGTLHVLDAHGAPLPGWPVGGPRDAITSSASGYGRSAAFTSGQVPRGLHAALLGAPSVAVAFGPEGRGTAIAALTAEGGVIVLDARGAVTASVAALPGATGSTLAATRHPARAPLGQAGAPVLADLDGDGTPELLLTTPAGELRHFTLAGLPLPDDRVELGPLEDGEVIGPPAIGDLDGDGRLDAVVASDRRVFLVYGSGRRDAIALPAAAVTAPALGLELAVGPAPALGDVDGDGAPEIVVATRGRPLLVLRVGHTTPAVVAVSDPARIGQRSDAAEIRDPILAGVGAVALADLDGDRVLDAVAAAAPVPALTRAMLPAARQHLLGMWSLADGAFIAGGPRFIAEAPLGGAAVADLDGDGRPEVVVGTGDGRVDAFDFDGGRPRLWPKLVGDRVAGAPAIGDLDGDGRLDVVVATRAGVLHAWRSSSRAGVLPAWGGFQHDAGASGNVATPTALLTFLQFGRGCACLEAGARAQSPRSRALATLVLGLALGIAVRRGHARRCRAASSSAPARTRER